MKKIGISVPDRILPKIDDSYMYVKKNPEPKPDRFFTPTPDNREQVLNNMKKEQEFIKQQRFNPDKIQRR